MQVPSFEKEGSGLWQELLQKSHNHKVYRVDDVRPLHYNGVVGQKAPAFDDMIDQNYTNLAFALWDEMTYAVQDARPHRILFKRIIKRLANYYRDQIEANNSESRLVQRGSLLQNRGVEDKAVAIAGSLAPVVRQYFCPYLDLAEVNRTICIMERKMIEKIVGRGLRITQCLLDGHRDFESKPLTVCIAAA